MCTYQSLLKIMHFSAFSLKILLTAFSLLAVTAEESPAEGNELMLTAKNGKLSGPGIGRDKSQTKFNGWTDTKVEIFWDIEFATAGDADIDFLFANRDYQAGALIRINFGNKNKNQTIEKPTEFSGGIDVTKLMRMGTIKVGQPGKYRLVIRALKKKHTYIGELYHIVLSGSAIPGSKVVDFYGPGAPSTHLTYSGGNNAMMLYNEMIINSSFPSSFFMAIGFSGGYFGIQENEFNGYKKALFSLWDVVSQERSGEDDLAGVEKAGKGVLVKRFGGEGTGYQSMIAFPWKTGKKYHFLLTSKPKDKYIVISAYIYYPKEQQWKLMSSLKRVVTKKLLNSFHSFLEDWVGKWGYIPRVASFNPWVRGTDGKWFQPQEATFSRTGKSPYVNGWVQDGRFYMSTGGSVKGNIKYGDKIKRNVADEFPSVLNDIDKILEEEKFLP